MEQIITEIWQDAERFGWSAIKSKKDYYLNLALKFNTLDFGDQFEEIESKLNNTKLENL